MADWDEHEPPSQTGRFHLPHRDGARVEVGEPVHVGGASPWLCAVKLLGRDEATDAEATQTLFIRSGRGATPEEARRSALQQLSLVMGSPVGPAPEARISRKVTDPPPSSARPRASATAATIPPVSQTPRQSPIARETGSWLSKLFGKKGA